MGKVWLVGAGPGDAGLFTLKGSRVLKDADVVVYDSLVGDAVMAMIPDDVRKIDVGKRAANHTMPQEQISQLLLDEALAGNNVVRLKGGDPFLFGRGGEELELLSEYGVPFEVVPGVPSALAVPAYNGIPITHRDFTSSVHIITGHKRAGADYDIDFEALVRTKGTLVFLMGVRSCADICAGLMDAGMDADMPAAILSKGTTAAQRCCIATVSTLAKRMVEEGIAAPAIIVVGGVCSLADAFGWYEKLPLSGCKVVLTRPRHLVSKTTEHLRRLGAEVLEVPAIETRAIKNNAVLDAALDTLASYDWVVFTSPTGVEVFFDALAKSKADARKLRHIAVLGDGTAHALAKYGIKADFTPSEAYGKVLGRELAQVAKADSRILIPRAKAGNADLINELSAFEVTDIPTYDTISLVDNPLNLPDRFCSGEIFCAVFTSSSGVRAFVKAHEGLDFSFVQAACIGKLTQQAAADAGMRTWMASEPSMDALVDLVCEQWSQVRA